MAAKQPARAWQRAEPAAAPAGGSAAPAALPLCVMTYNILADHYLGDNFAYCPPRFREWPYRLKLILRDSVKRDADVVCLQEVNARHYSKFLLPLLGARGYRGAFMRKTGRDALEGVATFYRADRLVLVASQRLPISELASGAGPRYRGEPVPLGGAGGGAFGGAGDGGGGASATAAGAAAWSDAELKGSAKLWRWMESMKHAALGLVLARVGSGSGGGGGGGSGGGADEAEEGAIEQLAAAGAPEEEDAPPAGLGDHGAPMAVADGTAPASSSSDTVPGATAAPATASVNTDGGDAAAAPAAAPTTTASPAVTFTPPPAGQQCIVVANVHVYWSPSWPEVKVLQVALVAGACDALRRGANAAAGRDDTAVLLAGDFNTMPALSGPTEHDPLPWIQPSPALAAATAAAHSPLPHGSSSSSGGGGGGGGGGGDSDRGSGGGVGEGGGWPLVPGVYELLTSGALPRTHPHHPYTRRRTDVPGGFSGGGPAIHVDAVPALRLPLRFESAYVTVTGREPEWSNWHLHTFVETLDYILIATHVEHLEPDGSPSWRPLPGAPAPVAVLAPPSRAAILALEGGAEGGCPNEGVPSDHIPLVAKLLMRA
jgi:endonuclease/exonuclease/phosphatase family metal-dependent hydrolase